MNILTRWTSIVEFATSTLPDGLDAAAEIARRVAAACDETAAFLRSLPVGGGGLAFGSADDPAHGLEIQAAQLEAYATAPRSAAQPHQIDPGTLLVIVQIIRLVAKLIRDRR